MPLPGIAAPRSGTQAASPEPLQLMLTDASQYPWFVFHMSSRPSPLVLLTVVLKITAPQDTQPLLLGVGITIVVAEVLSPDIGFGTFGFGKVQVGLSQP